MTLPPDLAETGERFVWPALTFDLDRPLYEYVPGLESDSVEELWRREYERGAVAGFRVESAHGERHRVTWIAH